MRKFRLLVISIAEVFQVCFMIGMTIAGGIIGYI
jgi:hypothetical protein